MPYTVYKVVNKLTGEFYIGVHKTNDPNDSYLGSGKAIRAQVALHGPENFTKEILASFDRRRDAYSKEAELVRPVLGTPGCLNLHPGGHGGFGYLNRPGGAGDLGRSRALAAESYRAAASRKKELLATDPAFRARTRAQLTVARELMVAKGSYLDSQKRATQAWTGQRHSDQTKSAAAARTRGAGNPMFGRRWLYHPTTLEVVLAAGDLIPHLQGEGWLPGKHPSGPPSRRTLPLCCLCGAPTRKGVCRLCSDRAAFAELQSKAVQLRAEGHDTKWLAEHLGVSRRTIYRMLGGSG